MSVWFERSVNEIDDWLDDIKNRWRGVRNSNEQREGEANAWDLEEFLATNGKVAERLDEIKEKARTVANKLRDTPDRHWSEFVREVGREWRDALFNMDKRILDLLKGEGVGTAKEFDRAKTLLEELLHKTPVPVLVCWLVFYPLLRDNEHTSVSGLLCNQDDCPDSELGKFWPAAQAIITLHAIVDETCVGWGIHKPQTDEEIKEFGGKALEYAEEMLFENGTMATIGHERCRILPKRHNPNIGITLRSLSSNLAFHRSAIDVVWRRVEGNPEATKKEGKLLANKLDRELKLNACATQSPGSSTTITALLLPWPMQIRTGDFHNYKVKMEGERLPIDLDESEYGFFVYSPKDPGFSEDDIIKMIDAANAEEENEAIDLLIMPESAITSARLSNLEQELKKRARERPDLAVSVLIAGVRDDPDETRRFARNSVHCRTIRKEGRNSYTYKEPDEDRKNQSDRTIQHKHHRWKLDAAQIKQYGLSTVLDTNKKWWEAIKVGRRRVSFVNIGNRITICPLICEDLARQDPIADLIRHVGPTLVVTILMDGPQKADRWSSRYAGVLSEDPGSAVITLSSYGMVRRWSSPYRQMSSVVALWNDGRGPAREIELARGAEGILLRLKVTSECEPVADSRVEKFPTAKIELLDVIQIYPRRS